MTEFYNKNKPLINNILFLLALVVFVYVFVKYLFTYVSPFVIGFIISLILNPLADLLNTRFKIPRSVCAFSLIIISIVLLIFLGTLIVSKIGSEIESFANNIPFFAKGIQEFINNIRTSIDNMLSFVPEDFKEFVDSTLIQLTTAATGFLGSTVKTGSVNVVSTLPNLLMNILLGLISAFFFIKDKYVIKELFQKKQVLRMTSRFSIVRTGLLTALSGYIKAQLTIMSILASICILGLTIMGNPYAIIIGLFASVIDALPVFGLGAVFWPWIAYSFIMHHHGQAIGLSIIYLVGFITRQMLEPKILGQQIGVHPLITLMSIYIGLRVFGFIGLLLGPVIVVSFKVMLQQTQDEY